MTKQLDDFRFFAKYPFTEEARMYLKDSLKVDFENLEDKFVAAAAEKIEKSIRTQTEVNFGERLKEIENSKEPYLTTTLISYPISKVIVGITHDNYIRRRYAKAEAGSVNYFLQIDNEENIFRVGKQIFDIKKIKDDLYSVPFCQYLNNIPEGKENKLVNMEIDNGFIHINKDVLAKMLSGYVFNSIISTQRLDKKDVPKMFIYFADELLKKYKRKEFLPSDFGPVDIEGFPPCMKKIVFDLKSESKVGHTPRFVLATFFANVNMGLDNAVEFFKEQVDFNEKKTRYYLEHAYGKRAGRKRYNAPSCTTMESYGVCYRDDSCKWKHPVMYYRNMKKSFVERKGKK